MSLDKYFSGICMVKAMQPFSAALGIRLGDVPGLLKVFDQSHLQRKIFLLEQLTVVTGIRHRSAGFSGERSEHEPTQGPISQAGTQPSPTAINGLSNTDAVPRARHARS